MLYTTPEPGQPHIVHPLLDVDNDIDLLQLKIVVAVGCYTSHIEELDLLALQGIARGSLPRAFQADSRPCKAPVRLAPKTTLYESLLYPQQLYYFK